MKSYRVPFYLVVVLLVAAVAFIGVQYKINQQLRNDIAELGEKSGKADRREENAALADELKAIEERTDAEHRELLRLRGQVSALRDKEKEIATLKSEREKMSQRLQSAGASLHPAPSEQTPERRRTIARLGFSKQLGLELRLFAEDHGKQLPGGLEAIDTRALSAIPENAAHNLQAEQFELLYKGRFEIVPDSSRTVLAREKEPVQLADGNWEQVYVFVDGHAEVLRAPSKEQLAQREREQFILPGNP